MRFDYIIVGGGSAGCVLANRLSANPKNTVCLIEAGPDTPPETVPASIYSEAFLPDYFQPTRYWTELEAYTEPLGNLSTPAEIKGKMKPRRYEQARVMGGGSTVNAQVLIRGLAADYDEWEQEGARGWGWQDCLPYFKRIERDLDFETPLSGTSGRIPIRRTFPEHWSPFGLSFREAAAARGIPYIDDSHQQEGDACFPFGRNNAYDHRVSAAAGYLDESTRRRPNLRILAETTVGSIAFEGNRAVGVNITRAGRIERIEAGEVVISAGAIHSPALLMHSGIGPGHHLQENSIAVVADRPGVGRNLLDHPLIGFGVHLRPEAHLADYVRNGFLMHMRWSSGHEDCSPVDMKLTVSGRFAFSPLGKRLGTVNFGPNKAYSAGYIELQGPDPRREPFVAFNYLSDSRDLDRFKTTARFVAGILKESPVSQYISSFWPGIYAASIRNLTQKSAINNLIGSVAAAMLDAGGFGRNMVLGAAIDKRFPLDRVLADEAVMEGWIRAGVQGDWHPCGTCRMGDSADRRTVVDPEGRVVGVEGLRVADASIMPTIPCANLNLTTMMIGERMADHILKA